jgi:hypothetical protein
MALAHVWISWWIKWHWLRFFSKYLVFPSLQTMTHLSTCNIAFLHISEILGLIIRPVAVCPNVNCDLPHPFDSDAVPTQLTLCSTVIIEKLTVSHLVKKLSAICEALALHKVCHSCRSCVKCYQPTSHVLFVSDPLPY